MTVPNEALGIALGFPVGIILGLLGGGGSILAVPIFLYVFHFAFDSAAAMSLLPVGVSAFVAFLGHWRQGSVNPRVGLPFGTAAMIGAYGTAKIAGHVPDNIRLALFAVFAFTSATIMLLDSIRTGRRDTVVAGSPRFTPILGIEALGVGALTALIGAGGGFIIVPALVYLARVPVREAVGTSLLIITLNALSGFAGYIGRVPIDWTLVGVFTGVTAAGAILGARLNRYLPQVRIKQAFALLILTLGTFDILRRLLT